MNVRHARTRQQDGYEAPVKQYDGCRPTTTRFLFKFLASAAIALFAVRGLQAQDLAPRAYIVAAVHSNAVTLSYSFSTGTLTFPGGVPITGATATIDTPVVSYVHSFRFFGRSATVLAALPYAVGNFHGMVGETSGHVYRSGLLASTFRVSVNLKGGPAMDAREYSKWRQKTLVGVSFTVTPPTGQYDSTKLINLGSNRWGFKPELGVSQRLGHWVLDGYAGVWFFTTNPQYFSHNRFNPGVATQSEKPVTAFEAHLSYDVKPRFWASLDGNFWFGGRTSINGKENLSTLQQNSRIGATVSVPLNKHQSLKFSYNNGAYIRYGGNYQNVAAGWQYSWLGRPK